MISTKNIIASIKDVPSEFIFEKYIALPEKLCGQAIKILSPLNVEKTPSFQLSMTKGVYYFKCFSTGRSGNAVNFVQELYKIDAKAAITLILREYKAYLKGEGVQESRVMSVHGRWKVVAHELRNWEAKDKEFWTKYGIGRPLLEKYNIAAVKQYTLSKDVAGVISSFDVSDGLIYGYFTKTGALAKIYRPGNKNKFINVTSYLQGSNQITRKTNTLLILSSMKDGLCFEALCIPDISWVAPASENSMIIVEDMKRFIAEYERVLVLFDEDAAGTVAAHKYENKYGIKGIYTTFGHKDISDAYIALGKKPVRNQLINLLK